MLKFDNIELPHPHEVLGVDQFATAAQAGAAYKDWLRVNQAGLEKGDLTLAKEREAKIAARDQLVTIRTNEQRLQGQSSDQKVPLLQDDVTKLLNRTSTTHTPGIYESCITIPQVASPLVKYTAYEVLGISKQDAADPVKLAAAFRDRTDKLAASDISLADQRVLAVDINQAFHILSDKDKLKAYNELGAKAGVTLDDVWKKIFRESKVGRDTKELFPIEDLRQEVAALRKLPYDGPADESKAAYQERVLAALADDIKTNFHYSAYLKEGARPSDILSIRINELTARLAEREHNETERPDRKNMYAEPIQEHDALSVKHSERVIKEIAEYGARYKGIEEFSQAAEKLFTLTENKFDPERVVSYFTYRDVVPTFGFLIGGKSFVNVEQINEEIAVHETYFPIYKKMAEAHVAALAEYCPDKPSRFSKPELVQIYFEQMPRGEQLEPALQQAAARMALEIQYAQTIAEYKKSSGFDYGAPSEFIDSQSMVDTMNKIKGEKDFALREKNAFSPDNFGGNAKLAAAHQEICKQVALSHHRGYGYSMSLAEAYPGPQGMQKLEHILAVEKFNDVKSQHELDLPTIGQEALALSPEELEQATKGLKAVNERLDTLLKSQTVRWLERMTESDAKQFIPEVLKSGEPLKKFDEAYKKYDELYSKLLGTGIIWKLEDIHADLAKAHKTGGLAEVTKQLDQLHQKAETLQRGQELYPQISKEVAKETAPPVEIETGPDKIGMMSKLGAALRNLVKGMGNMVGVA